VVDISLLYENSYNLRTELEQHLSHMFLGLRCSSIYNPS